MIPLLALTYVHEPKKLYRSVDRARRFALKAQAIAVMRESKKRMPKRKARSQPGQPPYSKSGNYRRSIRYQIGKTTAHVGSTWPQGAHGPLLHHGTKLMQPRPVLKIVNAELGPQLAERFRGKL